MSNRARSIFLLICLMAISDATVVGQSVKSVDFASSTDHSADSGLFDQDVSFREIRVNRFAILQIPGNDRIRI